jgi:hypothetical protein
MSGYARIDVEGTNVTVPAREVRLNRVEDASVVVRNFTRTAFTAIELEVNGSMASLIVRGDNADRAETLRRIAADLRAAAYLVEAGEALNTGAEL